MFRKVSRERSISTPSIINSLTGARDRTYSEESRFSRSQSPHSRTTGATTPTTAILDVPTWEYMTHAHAPTHTHAHTHTHKCILEGSNAYYMCSYVPLVRRLDLVTILSILKGPVLMADLSDLACRAKPPTLTHHWSSMLCRLLQLIVEMLPWSVQQAVSTIRSIDEA